MRFYLTFTPNLLANNPLVFSPKRFFLILRHRFPVPSAGLPAFISAFDFSPSYSLLSVARIRSQSKSSASVFPILFVHLIVNATKTSLCKKYPLLVYRFLLLRSIFLTNSKKHLVTAFAKTNRAHNANTSVHRNTIVGHLLSTVRRLHLLFLRLCSLSLPPQHEKAKILLCFCFVIYVRSLSHWLLITSHPKLCTQIA